MQYDNDLNSYIIINRSNVQNEAYAKIDIDSVNNLNSTITVRYNDESVQDENVSLSSTLTIPIKNKMFGTVDIVKTQKITQIIPCLKDAFVRSDQPVLNYGKEKDLLVGYSSSFDGIFRTFMDFNLLRLQKGLIITKATIKATRISTDNFIPNLEVYECLNSFDENDITWDNQPPMGTLLETFQGGTSLGQKYIYCDVTNSIIDWYEGNRFQTGFVFKSSDETYNQYGRTYSRESSFTPILEVEYFNPNPPSYGSAILNSKISVKIPAKNELNCTIIVPEYDFNNDLDSTITVRNNSYLDCKLQVLTDALNSKINVATGVNLNSIIKVKINTARDFNSQVAVSQPNISCKITVVNNYQMPCIINVTQIKDLDCKVKVRRYDISELNSNIKVTNILDLVSKLAVRRNEYKDLNSKIIVRRKDVSELNCTISTTRFSELSSKITVRRYNYNELSSIIKVRRYDINELNSKILVMFTNDLDSTIKVRRSEDNDLNSIINVRRYDDGSIDSTILISLFEELGCKILVSKGEVDSIIKVRRYLDDDFNGIVKISPTSEFLSKIKVTNYKELNSKISVRIPSAKDLSTKITVRDMSTVDCILNVRRYDNNEFDSQITVRRNDITDINSNVLVRRNENIDLNSTIHVRFVDGKNDISSKMFVYITDTNDLDSTILVINEGTEDLNSIIKTRPSNRMFGIVDILPAPKVNLTLKPVQDAYTRSQLPTFNYGSEIDMYVGNNSGELYRSFLQFDLSGIPTTRVFTKAILKLHSNTSYYTSGIQLDEVKDSWYENDITWNNQEDSLSTIKAVSSVSGSIIEIDLMYIIDNWFNGSMLQNGFIIKSLDESIQQRLRLYSRESVYPPTLEIEYFDTTVKSNVSNDFLSKIFVMSVENKDLSCSITVPNYNLESDLDSSLVVNNNGYLDSKITVIRGDLDCKLVVKRNEENNLDSLLKVRLNEINELSSTIIVNNPYINSIITVKRNEIDNIDSNLIVRRNEILSLDSKVVVRRNEYKELNSKIIVNNPDIASIIKVTPTSELYSSIIVRRNDVLDLNNKLSVTQRSDLNCVINVLTNELIGCIIKVRNTWDSELDSKIIVTTYNNLDSLIEVTNHANLSSTIKVRRYSDIDLNSKINIIANDNLDSKINVIKPSYLNSVIKIRNTKEIDLNSKIDIISVENLDCIIRVAKGDISCKIKVRRNEYNDLDNKVEITPTNDLNGIISVSNISELSCKIITRTPYNNDLSSKIEVLGSLSDLECKIVVGNKIIGYVFIM